MHSVAIGPTSWWLSSALALKILCSSKLFWAEIEWHYVALSAELSYAGSTPLANLAILQKGLVELPSSPAAQLCSKHGFSAEMICSSIRKSESFGESIRKLDKAPWEIVLYLCYTSSNRTVRVWVPNLELPSYAFMLRSWSMFMQSPLVRELEGASSRLLPGTSRAEEGSPWRASTFMFWIYPGAYESSLFSTLYCQGKARAEAASSIESMSRRLVFNRGLPLLCWSQDWKELNSTYLHKIPLKALELSLSKVIPVIPHGQVLCGKDRAIRDFPQAETRLVEF